MKHLPVEARHAGFTQRLIFANGPEMGFFSNIFQVMYPREKQDWRYPGNLSFHSLSIRYHVKRLTNRMRSSSDIYTCLKLGFGS